MIVLFSYSISKVLVGVLFISLAILVLTIAYRKLLAYLGKGTAVAEDYCVLYSLEEQPSKGEIEFYFTSKIARKVTFQIINLDFSLVKVLQDKEVTAGGNIIRFDSSGIPNGEYFYQIVTENQKTMKKFVVNN